MLNGQAVFRGGKDYKRHYLNMGGVPVKKGYNESFIIQVPDCCKAAEMTEMISKR